MNQLVVAAAQRQIAEIERRVAQQWALVEQLVAADREASHATRTLHQLQHTLSLTKKHVRFLTRDETG